MRKSVLTFLAFLALIAQLAVSGCDGTGRTAQEHLTSAKEYLDADNLRAGLIELKSTLQKEPDHPEARWLAAKVHLSLGNGSSAIKELTRAEELGIPATENRTLWAHAYFLTGQADKLLDLPFPEDDAPASEHAEFHTWRGDTFRARSDHDSAIAEYDAALTRDNGHQPAYIGMIAATLAQGDPAQARSMVEDLLKEDQDSARAWALLGDIELAENKSDLAEQAYTRALEINPDGAQYRLRRILTRLSLSDIEGAGKDIKILHKRFPQHPQINYVRGLLDFVSGKYGSAQNKFEKSLQVAPEFTAANFYLGIAHLLQGHNEQALQFLYKSTAAQPGYLPSVKALALAELKSKDYNAAEKLLRPYARGLPEDVMLQNLLASSLMGQGRVDEAVTILQALAESGADPAVSQTRLGIGLLLQGDAQAGLEALGTAIDLQPEFRHADMLYVMTQMRLGDYDKALEAGKSYVERSPDSPVPHNLLGGIYLATGERELARQSFEAAWNLAPGDPSSGHNLAGLATTDEDFASAEKYYQGILEKHPSHTRTIAKLSELYSKQEQPEAIEALLQKVTDAPEATPDTYILLAQHYIARNENDQAMAVLYDALQTHKDNIILLVQLGRTQLATGDGSTAKSTFKRLLDLKPSSPEIHYLMARAYKANGEWEKMEMELRRAISILPAHVMSRIDLANLKLSQNDPEAAREHFEYLYRHAPSEPMVQTLKGDLEMADLEFADAAASYQKALDVDPSSDRAVKLAKARWALEDRSASISGLEQWLKTYPDDVPALLALGNNYLFTGNDARAATTYEKVLDLLPGNITAMNNLAWIIRESDPDRARELAENATRRAPTTRGPRDTLVTILIETGQYGQAEQAIETGLIQRPDDTGLKMHKAIVLKQTGRTDEARNLLEILRDQGNDAERQQALSLLQELP